MLRSHRSIGDRPRHRITVLLIAVFGAIAIAVPSGAQVDSETPAASSAAEGADVDKVLLAEQPDLPPTVSPLDETRRAELRVWVAAAEKFRGLALTSPLAAGVQGQESARATLAGLLAEELPPAEAEIAERILEVLGLWPADRDLITVMLEVLSSEVAGYYDSTRDYLALVEGVGDEIDSGLGSFGDAFDERVAGAVWVHEVGHALQDQHFDLEALGIGDDALLSDRSLALGALVEGDATLVMFSYVMGTDLETLPMAREMVEGFTSDPDGLASLVADQGDTDAMLQAPAYLQESLVFPYLQGLVFCLAVRQAGGQELLDHIFAHDPPTSTEQILHPEKWLEMRDEPVAITIPDLTPWLDDRAFVEGGDLGELTIRVMLTERLVAENSSSKKRRGEARTRAQQAAAGWGGDAMAFYAAPGAEQGVLVWVSEWDDQAEADEFLTVAGEAFVIDDASATRPDSWLLAHRGTRVAMIHGLGGDEASVGAGNALIEHLLAMPVARVAPSPVDLAALGIGVDATAEDSGAPADTPGSPPDAPTGLAAMLADPVMQSLITQQLGEGAEELVAMFLEDPDLLQMAMEIGMAMASGEETPDLGRLMESIDLEAIQSSPAAQALSRKLLGEQEVVQATYDEGVVTLARLGFSMPLSADAAWDHDEAAAESSAGDRKDPAGADIVPMAFQAREAGSGASLAVLVIELPVPASLETVVSGAQAENLGAGRIVRSGYLETDGIRGWEREVVMTDAGGRDRTVQRIYLVDRHVITIVAGGPAKRWKKVRSKIRPALEGIAFTSPEG